MIKMTNYWHTTTKSWRGGRKTLRACTTTNSPRPLHTIVSQPDPHIEREQYYGTEGRGRIRNSPGEKTSPPISWQRRWMNCKGPGSSMTDDLEIEQMTNRVDAMTSDTLNKERQPRQCYNYRTINLINHLSKVMLHIIRNWLKTKVEELLAEK